MWEEDKIRITRMSISEGTIGLRLVDFGAIGDGAADDTVAVRNAINAAAESGRMLHCASGHYRLTSEIVVPGAIRLLGEGFAVDRGSELAGNGTWFHIAHSGVGFRLLTTQQGGIFEGFGTWRDQPTPQTGWRPNAHDFDFWMSPHANEWTFRDLMLLNPTRGIKCSNRPLVDNVKMQAFIEGICIDDCRDTARLQNVHVWPFWSESEHVARYTIGSLDAFRLLRCDNPTMISCFSIWHRRGISIEQGMTGAVFKLHATCCDFDVGQNGIVIEGGVTDATLYVSDIATQGAPAYTDLGLGIQVAGRRCTVIVNGLCSFDHGQGLVRVDGAENRLIVQGADLRNWDRGNRGFAAASCSAESTFVLRNHLVSNSLNPAAPQISGPVQT